MCTNEMKVSELTQIKSNQFQKNSNALQDTCVT